MVVMVVAVPSIRAARIIVPRRVGVAVATVARPVPIVGVCCPEVCRGARFFVDVLREEVLEGILRALSVVGTLIAIGVHEFEDLGKEIVRYIINLFLVGGTLDRAPSEQRFGVKDWFGASTAPRVKFSTCQ